MECVICRRFPDLRTGKHAEVHHIASGTSRQNHWLVAPLCPSITAADLACTAWAESASARCIESRTKANTACSHW
jgi:hypothetical protein